MIKFSQFIEEKKKETRDSIATTVTSSPLRGQNQDQSGFSPSHSTADYTISDSKKTKIKEGFVAGVGSTRQTPVTMKSAGAAHMKGGSHLQHDADRRRVQLDTFAQKRREEQEKERQRAQKEREKASIERQKEAQKAIKTNEALDEARRGRPPKNKTAEDPGSDNIIMQLRKVITLRGQTPVTFVDGKKANLSPSTAHRLLAMYDNLKTSAEKHAFSQRIHKSSDSMRDVIAGKKEVKKPKISLGGSYRGK